MAGNIPKDFIRMIFWYCFLCSFWWLKENGPFCTGLVVGIVSGIGCSETYIMAQSLKCSFSRVKLTFLCDTVTHRSFPALCAENPCLGSCLSWLLLSHKTIFFFFSFWIWISYLWMGLIWMLGGVLKEKCWQMEMVHEALRRTVLLAGICRVYCLSRVEHAHCPWGRQSGILISQGSKLSLREIVWPTWCHKTKQ